MVYSGKSEVERVGVNGQGLGGLPVSSLPGYVHPSLLRGEALGRAGLGARASPLVKEGAPLASRPDWAATSGPMSGYSYVTRLRGTW